MTARELWSPAISNWFSGVTASEMEAMSCRQIMDMYQFISRNSASG